MDTALMLERHGLRVAPDSSISCAWRVTDTVTGRFVSIATSREAALLAAARRLSAAAAERCITVDALLDELRENIINEGVRSWR